jgi:hypothetical protein
MESGFISIAAGMSTLFPLRNQAEQTNLLATPDFLWQQTKNASQQRHVLLLFHRDG